MTEQEMLDRMVAPGTRRPGKYREGVIQILVTSSCDKSCYSCTQASNIRRKPWFMTPGQFEQAVKSLGFEDLESNAGWSPKSAYFGVVGLFGGNPAISPHFAEYCKILRKLVPYEQRGIWCNNPLTLDKAKMMAETFDPSVSNLNVHLDQNAYTMFKQGWPGCSPVGLTQDSRHSPPFVAMKDVVQKVCPKCKGLGDRPLARMDDEGYTHVVCNECGETGKVADTDRICELISGCDINQHWSAMVGVFRGELRAWFCEVAGAQAILHQDEPGYPDTGISPLIRYSLGGLDTGDELAWWQCKMVAFAGQVRKHCWDCGVPLRGYGQLSQATGDNEQVSATHEALYRPKVKERGVEVVTKLEQLGLGRLGMVTKYLQNSHL